MSNVGLSKANLACLVSELEFEPCQFGVRAGL